MLLLNAKKRVALSGTPIENNLLELYSLFRFLNPEMFGSVQEFTNDYIVPIQKYSDTSTIEELRKKIYPFLLRRVNIEDSMKKEENIIIHYLKKILQVREILINFLYFKL